MSNVLVFESDSNFAGELKGELERRGCAVTVVDDASVGLQTAASDKPDLILLTIELPRMNGFSVCNKLKRDPALKEVPLIIMSSDSTEETFEQHRRLRTHAEDYVHKPIAFVDLLLAYQRRTYRSPKADTATRQRGSVDDDIVIDDDIDFEEETAQAPPAGRAGEPDRPSHVDDEVDAFTESAFGAMVDEARRARRAAPERRLPPPSRAHSVRGLAIDESDRRTRSRRRVVRPSEPPQAAAASPVEVERRRRRLRRRFRRDRELESIDQVVQGRARQASRQDPRARARAPRRARAGNAISKIRRSAPRPRTPKCSACSASSTTSRRRRRAPRKGGGSAREFLDLREALNKKDKELLDLRDQLTHKEKELLGLRDTNLAAEREKADLGDRIIELEKQTTDADAPARQREGGQGTGRQARRRLQAQGREAPERARREDDRARRGEAQA